MRKRVRPTGGLTVWSLLALVLVAGCAPKTIGHVLADPQRYAHKEVKLKGEVARSYSVLGRGAYELRDHTGRLWIVSDRGVPREGTEVEVKGTIRDAFDLGSILPTRGLGVVMMERSHKARY
jgi:hypothetical protein